MKNVKEDRVHGIGRRRGGLEKGRERKEETKSSGESMGEGEHEEREGG